MPMLSDDGSHEQLETYEDRLSVLYQHDPHLGVRWGISEMLTEPLLVLPEQGRSTTDTATLDKYIASFCAHLAALKSHRNSTVPAVCLPDELLSEIFLHTSCSGTPLLCGRLQSWSHLMLVCRRWRAIGVSTPGLWSRMHVGMRARDPAHLILPSPHQRIRCKNHPLTITIDLERDSTGQATSSLLQVLAPHIDQFVSLKLVGTESCFRRFLDFYTASRRVGLQTLSLIFQPANDRGPFVLSQEATQNIVPCLRTLYLLNVAVEWDALRDLQSLTMYFYSFIDSDAPQPITLSALLSMLRRSPHLTKFHLLTRNGLDMLDAQAESVHLPCLRYLYLTAHPLLCAAILASIRMESWSDIVIQTSDVPENEYQRLHDALGGLFDRPGAPAMRCMRLTSSPVVLFTTDLPADEGQPVEIPRESGAKLSITGYPDDSPEMQERLLARLLSVVPSRTITSLDCGPRALLQRRNLCLLILRSLPSLQRISCRGGHDEYQIWFDALRDWAGSVGSDHKLRSFRWDLEEDDSAPTVASLGERIRRVSKDLQDVLDACARGGLAVRRLVISSEWQSHNMVAVINLVTHARGMGVKVDMVPDTVYCEILFDTPEAE